jgi:hypothetical protein
MVCTARALKGAPVVIRLVSRFNTDKEHRDAASRASPRTKRSLFSTKTAWLRHSYSPTNSKTITSFQRCRDGQFAPQHLAALKRPVRSTGRRWCLWIFDFQPDLRRPRSIRRVELLCDDPPGRLGAANNPNQDLRRGFVPVCQILIFVGPRSNFFTRSRKL